MYVVTSFLCFTTQSCPSCTLSPLFYVSLHRAVLHVHCHLFLIFHYTQLFFMYVVTSFLCFTTHRAVLHVHCHLFFMFHYRAVLHVHCHLFFLFHYRAVLHAHCHLFLCFTTELYFMHIVTSFF
jgi:hypothetical protein